MVVPVTVGITVLVALFRQSARRTSVQGDQALGYTKAHLRRLAKSTAQLVTLFGPAEPADNTPTPVDGSRGSLYAPRTTAFGGMK
jgi:hypothetical protein